MNRNTHFHFQFTDSFRQASKKAIRGINKEKEGPIQVHTPLNRSRNYMRQFQPQLAQAEYRSTSG